MKTGNTFRLKRIMNKYMKIHINLILIVLKTQRKTLKATTKKRLVIYRISAVYFATIEALSHIIKMQREK